MEACKEYQAYPAYYENGRIIPRGNPQIPEGCDLVITVLDKSVFSPVKPKSKTDKKEALETVLALGGCLKGTPYENYTRNQIRDERLKKHID